MKKFILTIILATTLGLILGLYLFKNIDNNIDIIANKVDNSIYAIQVGVYKNYDNAYNMSNKYKGIIVFDDGLYRVYIDIIKNKEILNKKEEYYKNNNINYYLKIINVSSNFENILDEYEILRLQSDKEDIIIDKILKEYKDEIQD